MDVNTKNLPNTVQHFKNVYGHANLHLQKKLIKNYNQKERNPRKIQTLLNAMEEHHIADTKRLMEAELENQSFNQYKSQINKTQVKFYEMMDQYEKRIKEIKGLTLPVEYQQINKKTIQTLSHLDVEN